MILGKGFILLPLKIVCSTIMEKRVHYSTHIGRLIYDFAKRIYDSTHKHRLIYDVIIRVY
jgi:hypothetical protein